MRKTSIIVPVHDLLRHTRLCLESVRSHTSLPYEILVADNGSGHAVRSYLRRLRRSWPELRVLRSEENLTFARSVNRAMDEARGSYIVWLNNDAVVTPEWLQRLIACVESDPAAGAAGPCTNDKGSTNCLAMRHRPSPKRMPVLGQAWSLFLDGQREPVPTLTAFCMLLKREAVLSTGLLDERFQWGNEDDDYCYRLRLGGWKLLVAKDVLVYHRGHSSLLRHPPARRRARAEANRRLLLKKWLADAKALQSLVRKYYG